MTRLAPVAALVIAPFAVAASQDPPAFRGAADLVSVFATVTDRDGRHVPGLTPGDFDVFDNGVRQDIVQFSATRQPFAVVLMLDRSGSMREHSRLIRDAGTTFIQMLEAGDVARIGSFSTDISLLPDRFTGDRSVLLRALREDTESGGGSPVWAALNHGIEALGEVPMRRVILLASDGNSDREELRHIDIIERARRHDVMVYTAGLSVTVETRQPVRTPQFPIPMPPGGGGWRFARSAPETGTGSPETAQRTTRTRMPPDRRLINVAMETGGRYFELTESDNLRRTFAAIADELHNQYWLGFVPARLDHAVHRLEVKVLKPRLSVRARQSYVADLAK